MKIKPIGHTRSEIKKQQFSGLKGKITEIVLDGKYTEALEGLRDYSHIVVLYWMNEAEGIVKLEHQPQGNPKVPEVGIFAIRCQWRPNCIGISTVPLVSFEKNVIKVRDLDIIDNTQILDMSKIIFCANSLL